MTSLEIARHALLLWNVAPPQSAEFVVGGLTHRLLRVESEAEVYALKLWSPRALAVPARRHNLERAETLAAIAARHQLPAMAARPGQNGRYLQTTGGQWFSLYPWIDGETLPPHAAAPARCQTMGALLGRLHALQIRFPEQSEPAPEAFERGHFAAILNRARVQGAPYVEPLAAALDELEDANARALRAQCELRAGWTMGHLDFDQKNVLWQNQNPTILDWENAKPIHPALEAMGAALSWAGQPAGAPQFESFAAFMRAYRAHNDVTGDALNTAVDGVLGKWIIWLEFNLQRMLEPQIGDTPEFQIALDAGLHALRTTRQLRADGALYRRWLGQI